MRIEVFLRESPLVQMNRAVRRMEASLNEALAEDGLSLFEALALAAVFLEGARAVKPSELAEAFDTTRSNVSHCVSSLEAKGLLERRIDAEDARAMRLTLKPLGKKRAMRVVKLMDRVQGQLEKEIGAERLIIILGQMRAVTAVCSRVALAG